MPRPTIFDPVRKKRIVLTPEEEVRQFVIRFLQENCGVPLGYIGSELPVKLYQRDLRCDLAVRNKRGEAVMLIECKRPSVSLGEKVLEQVLRYDMLRRERFIVITNGLEFRCWERCEIAEENEEKTVRWREWERYPTWEELNRS